MVTFPCCSADAGTTIPWGLSVPVMALWICCESEAQGWGYQETDATLNISKRVAQGHR